MPHCLKFRLSNSQALSSHKIYEVIDFRLVYLSSHEKFIVFIYNKIVYMKNKIMDEERGSVKALTPLNVDGTKNGKLKEKLKEVLKCDMIDRCAKVRCLRL